MKVALGFRAHSGWAVVVAVAESRGGPLILARRRIETADPKLRGSRQPFHAAEPLDFAEAGRLIARCRESSLALAGAAVAAVIAELEHAPRTAAIVTASGRPLPDLAAILRSHALIHTAEGEFFRDILAQAAESCGLPVSRIPEREIPMDVRALVDPLGKELGPPWRSDEKLAAAAAWLAGKGRRKITTAGP